MRAEDIEAVLIGLFSNDVGVLQIETRKDGRSEGFIICNLPQIVSEIKSRKLRLVFAYSIRCDR